MEETYQIDETVESAKSTKSAEVTAPPSKFEELLEKYFGEIEFNRYGLISIIIIVVCITGGIAVGVGAMLHPIQIALLAFPTVISISLILAIAPMKTIFASSIISIAISVAIIIINLAM